MAIAFDASATPVSSNANVASLTTSAFTISGSERLLVVGVLSGASTPVSPNAVKWGGSGGASLTQVGSTLTIATNVNLSMWYLKAPSTGSATVYVAWPSNQDETAVVAASFTGVDQTTTLRTPPTPTTGNTTTPSINVTSVSGDIVVDVVGFLDVFGQSLTLAQGAGQTSAGEVEGTSLQYEGLGISYKSATTTTTTMTWTVSGELAGWGQFGVALIPGSGVTDTPLSVTSASLALTGQDVTLTSGDNQTITVTQSTLSLAGQDITLAAGSSLTITVTEATVALAGQDVSFLFDTPWTEATLGLTGQDVTLTAQQSVTLTVTEAALSLTGQAITLTALVDVPLTVTGAALTLSGQDVTFLVGAGSVIVTVDTATLLLTGTNIDISPSFTIPTTGVPRRKRYRGIRRNLNIGR